MDNTRKDFDQVKVGDVVVCYDEYQHDYVEHEMVVTSIEDDKADVCEDNPLGRKLYGNDITDYSDESMICMVHPGNFVSIRPVPTNADELFKYVYDAYMNDSVELSSAYFDFNVKMPEKDILLAWKLAQENINGDYVYRSAGTKEWIDETRPVYDEDDNFVPEGEYEDIYEGKAGEFLSKFNDRRFGRRDYEDSPEEFDFIY